jgi:hypothetical protein
MSRIRPFPTHEAAKSRIILRDVALRFWRPLLQKPILDRKWELSQYEL